MIGPVRKQMDLHFNSYMGEIYMTKDDAGANNKEITTNIEKLRRELENLITVKEYNLDNEVLTSSTKLDEALSRYYRTQRILWHNLK